MNLMTFGKKPDGQSTTIAIDIGASYSRVAQCVNGKITVFTTDTGQYNVPSVLAFDLGKIYIGEDAIPFTYHSSSQTASCVKRLLGNTFDNQVTQQMIGRVPYKISSQDGKPVIDVSYEKTTGIYKPEEMMCLIIKKMKQIAEINLRHAVDKAVLTVPAYFTDAQRECTLAAGKMAGLKVLRLVNDPTCTAIKYACEKMPYKKPKVLVVVDFGGSKLDVAVMEINKTTISVQSVSGICALGGMDFDNILTDHFAKEIKDEFQIDITADKHMMAQLRTACERIKRELSTSHTATMVFSGFYKSMELRRQISRVQFEELAKHLFDKIAAPINDAIRDIISQKSHIEKVMVMGGSSKIPKVQEILERIFDPQKLCNSLDYETTVVKGAAIHASILTSENKHKFNQMKMIDVLPYSLGIEIKNKMDFAARRNEKVPARFKKPLQTSSDYQKVCTLPIYEGEYTSLAENHYLGTTKLYNLPTNPRGQTKFDVIFDIDQSGILVVSVIMEETKLSGVYTTTKYLDQCYE